MGVTLKANTKEVIGKLDKFNLSMVSKVKDELEATAQEITTDAKKKITSDGHVDTGRLRASIGVLNTRVDGLGIEVGTKVEYARKIEQTDSYLFYAWEKNRPKHIKRIKRIIK